MPRVLVVSYPWLPAFNGGVKLAASLCRYLPEAGWDPTILTRDWAEGMSPEDAALGLEFELGELPPSLRAASALPTVRTAYGPRENTVTRLRDSLAAAEGAEPRGAGGRLAQGVLEAAFPLYGAYPDAHRGWEAPAVAAGVAAVRQYGMGAVVSISSPATAHIIGGEIARQAELPWVPLFGRLDSFRVDQQDGRTSRRRMEHRVLARRWLRGASRLAAPTVEMLEHLQQAYDIPGEVIAAPFDPEERRLAPRRAPGAPLRLVHVGRLGADLSAIALLADALDALLGEGSIGDELLRVELVGSRREAEVGALLAGRRCAGSVRLAARVTPAEAVRMQREADLLLLPDGASGDALVPPPLVLAEQVNARRPTLHLAPSGGGASARVLAETGAGWTATTPAEAGAIIRGAVDEVRASGELPFRGDEAAIARHGATDQARRLAGMLDAASVGRFGRWQRV